MAKQTRATKNRVDRVRRQVEKGIRFCKENGIKLTTGEWMSGTTACAIGAVLAKEGFDPDSDNHMGFPNWEQAASKSLGITEDEVISFIECFDDPDVVGDYLGQSRVDAMARLGARLNRKYGPL